MGYGFKGQVQLSDAVVKVEIGGLPTRLENYTFLTPRVEVKHPNLYEGFHESDFRQVF